MAQITHLIQNSANQQNHTGDTNWVRVSTELEWKDATVPDPNIDFIIGDDWIWMWSINLGGNSSSQANFDGRFLTDDIERYTQLEPKYTDNADGEQFATVQRTASAPVSDQEIQFGLELDTDVVFTQGGSGMALRLTDMVADDWHHEQSETDFNNVADAWQDGLTKTITKAGTWAIFYKTLVTIDDTTSDYASRIEIDDGVTPVFRGEIRREGEDNNESHETLSMTVAVLAVDDVVTCQYRNIGGTTHDVKDQTFFMYRLDQFEDFFFFYKDSSFNQMTTPDVEVEVHAVQHTANTLAQREWMIGVNTVAEGSGSDLAMNFQWSVYTDLDGAGDILLAPDSRFSPSSWSAPNTNTDWHPQTIFGVMESVDDGDTMDVMITWKEFSDIPDYGPHDSVIWGHTWEMKPYSDTVPVVQSKTVMVGGSNNDVSATFDSTPTAGNLLTAYLSLHDDGGTITMPSGWAEVHQGYSGTAAGGAMAWKVSEGDESGAITFDWVSTIDGATIIIIEGPPAGSLDVSQEAASVGAVTEQTTGTTSTSTEQPVQVYAMWAIDAGQNWDFASEETKGFKKVVSQETANAGLWVAERAYHDLVAIESEQRTGDVGDQVYAVVAAFFAADDIGGVAVTRLALRDLANADKEVQADVLTRLATRSLSDADKSTQGGVVTSIAQRSIADADKAVANAALTRLGLRQLADTAPTKAADVLSRIAVRSLVDFTTDAVRSGVAVTRLAIRSLLDAAKTGQGDALTRLAGRAFADYAKAIQAEATTRLAARSLLGSGKLILGSSRTSLAPRPSTDSAKAVAGTVLSRISLRSLTDADKTVLGEALISLAIRSMVDGTVGADIIGTASTRLSLRPRADADKSILGSVTTSLSIVPTLDYAKSILAEATTQIAIRGTNDTITLRTGDALVRLAVRSTGEMLVSSDFIAHVSIPLRSLLASTKATAGIADIKIAVGVNVDVTSSRSGVGLVRLGTRTVIAATSVSDQELIHDIRLDGIFDLDNRVPGVLDLDIALDGENVENF